MFITGFAVKLGLVLVDAAGVEWLGAGLALDALLVEGGAVHRHAGLGRVDAGLAGRALRHRPLVGPTHCCRQPECQSTVERNVTWPAAGER